MITVRDHVLDEGGFGEVRSEILKLPYGLMDHKVSIGDETDCFVHGAYFADCPRSDIFELLHSYFCCPLDVVVWFRIKINITLKDQESKLWDWHVDYESFGEKPQYANMKTSIFYLNDTNGPTVFKDGTEVECVRNRLLTFPSPTIHSGRSHTEGDNKRIVINFNYF